jgi:hypothetical protein
MSGTKLVIYPGPPPTEQQIAALVWRWKALRTRRCACGCRCR